MIYHPHTRSDYCQTYAPRIPQPPKAPPRTEQQIETERRIRRLLTWHAGDCGLIDDRLKDWLASMLLQKLVTIDQLYILANTPVFLAIAQHADSIRNALKD